MNLRIFRRVQRLRESLEENKFDAFLITGEENILYYTGLTITDRAFLIVDKESSNLFLSPLDNHVKVKGIEIFELNMSKIKKALGFYKKIGFDESFLSAREFLFFRKNHLLPASKLIQSPRFIKEKWEIEQIRKSIRIVFKILECLELEGKSEEDIKKEIEILALKFGSEKAFNPIVATGSNTIHIHHLPTKRHIKGLTLIDMGVKWKGYCSDITRMFTLDCGQKERRLIEEVKDIQMSIIEGISEGMKFSDVQRFYEELMRKKRYKVFHSFGHGIGLSPHEGPFKDDTIQNGMVFTVEPGVYEGKRGCRIEDIVVVKNGKVKILF